MMDVKKMAISNLEDERAYWCKEMRVILRGDLIKKMCGEGEIVVFPLKTFEEIYEESDEVE